MISGFYVPGVHFKCRFCATDIGTWKGKQLAVLENYRMLEVDFLNANTNDTPIKYRFNCCSDCSTKILPEEFEKSYEFDIKKYPQLKRLGMPDFTTLVEVKLDE